VSAIRQRLERKASTPGAGQPPGRGAAPGQTLLLALVLLALCAAPARAQDIPDDLAADLSADEAADAQVTEVVRSNALPPRRLDDITQALQRYQPDPRKTARAREAAQAPPPATDDKQVLFNFYMKRAVAASRIGLLSQRISDIRLAAESAPDLDHHKRAMRLLALAEATGGNYLTAINIYEQEVMAARTSRRNIPRAFNENCNLAHYRAQLGDVEEAKQNLKNCEARFDRREQKGGQPEATEHYRTALFERAQVAVAGAEGRLADAEAAARKALMEMEAFMPLARERERQGLMPRSVLVLRQSTRDGDERRLAEILMQRGKLVEAEIASRNVLRSFLARFGLYSLGTGTALTTLSRVVFEQGRFREAATLAAAAIDSFEQSGAIPESLPLVEARRAYGAALAAQKHWNEAIGEFGKMQAGLERDPLLAQKYGGGDINWAWALIKTGNADAALTMLEPMVSRTRQRLGERAYQTAELRGFYAVALAAKQDKARALKEFAEAVPVLLEQSRADDASESGGIARTLRRVQILEAYIALLAEQGAAGAAGAVAESFRIADAARGSTVQRALAASAARAQISDPQLAKLAREEQDEQQRIATLTDLLARLLGAPPDQQLPKVIGDMRREIDNLQNSRATLKAEILRSFPAYASLVNPQPATIAQARAALRAGEALVSIYVADSATYVWAVPREGAPMLAVVKRGDKEIAETVVHLRKALDPGNVGFDSIPRFDVAAAHQLYVDLLQPVEPAWKGATSLAIVPARALAQLPFALLVTEPATLGTAQPAFAEYRNVAWLTRRVAVTQLPSVSTLVTLRQEPAGGADRRPFLGFGDPVFSKQQLAQTASLATTTRGVRLRSVPTTRGEVNSAELAELPRLPDTALEIREIAASLKADPSEVFLGVAANEKNVKSADLTKYRVIAFATHGLIPGDLDGLDQPALALTAPDVANVDGDGLLTMDEVLALKLRADWVVLSACNTAAGGGAGSEAVSGLGRAFFFAGARALLVSNWPVETTSARAITTELFRLQAEQPQLTRAEALRQAMLYVIDGPGYVDAKSPGASFSYAHPLFWAPFSLVGDGGAS